MKKLLLLLALLSINWTMKAQVPVWYNPNVPSVLVNGSTAATQPNPYDYTTDIATDQFVVRLTNIQMATTPLSGVTGGTYSFNSACTGTQANLTAIAGAVTSILVWIPVGSGCQAGDVITFQAGNYDALVQITSVNGSGQPTAGTILYGGTGYSSGTAVAETGANAVQFTFLLSGTLTRGATFVMPFGSYLLTSNQWFWANNTTGAFTTTVCQAGSAGANTCAGGGRTAVLPQGTANSCTALLNADGIANVDVVYNQCAASITGGSATGLTALSTAALTAIGTKFSVTGCGTATSLVGGSLAGKFVAAQAACTPVISTNLTAPTGYSCWMNDQTTTSVKFQQTAYSQTTATFTATGTLGGTDTINFGCLEF
jgi:hypothetical protein